jgi:hypothetical protein
MDRGKTARNVAIVATIAAAVFLLPGGGRAARTFEAAILVAFGVAIAYLGLRLYRERRVAIYSLGDRYRGILYGSIALGVFALCARGRMWQTGVGELAWFVLVSLVVAGLLTVYRYSRTY